MHNRISSNANKAVVAGLALGVTLCGVFASEPNVAFAADNGATKIVDLTAAEGTDYTGWARDESTQELYWLDAGVMARTKEVYDPETDAWYWFDSDGTMAFDKDVWIPDLDKWVRYDENAHMIKGFDIRYEGKYYFDPITGEMLHGEAYLDENVFPEDSSLAGWYHFDEIDGKMDVGKDAYIRSSGGKWCRYDEIGRMVHGEDYRLSKNDGKMHWWYFDTTTGAMQKGLTTIPDGNSTKTVYYDPTYGWMLYGSQSVNGTILEFDSVTGALIRKPIQTDSYTSEKAQEIIDIANGLIGISYQRGGVSPSTGFSCDGFTAYVYSQADVQAWGSWPSWDNSSMSTYNGQLGQLDYFDSIGALVFDIDKLMPGDIVFFGTNRSNLRHAGIYIGEIDGVKKMIHSCGYQPVDGPRHGVEIESLDSDFVAGGSPVNHHS